MTSYYNGDLKKDLEKYRIQLADQKKQKDDLLRITQNNESVYQEQIRAAQEEQNAIYAILRGLGNEVSLGPVAKGSSVGYMISGRSACSSGTHLHFEVRSGGTLLNPLNFLK